MKKRLELPLSEELKARLHDETEEGVWLGPVFHCLLQCIGSDCEIMSESRLQLGQESQSTNVFTDDAKLSELIIVMLRLPNRAPQTPIHTKYFFVYLIWISVDGQPHRFFFTANV